MQMQAIQDDSRVRGGKPANDGWYYPDHYRLGPNDLRDLHKYPGIFTAKFGGFELTCRAIPANSNTP